MKINLGLFGILIAFSQIAFATAPTTRPTLYLVGDSTVHVGTPGEQGWGDPLIKMFDETKINVLNKAVGGRSSRSFIDEGKWDDILKSLSPGDFVIVQMGHNDGGPLAGDIRERGSIRGIGDETKEVTLTLDPNKGKQITVHTYGWYLRKYINDAKDKGATPIICSWIPHCPRPGEKVEVPTEATSYALWAQQVAEAEHVAFIDLNRLIWKKWVDEKLSPEQIKEKYFTPTDFTHTSKAGAALNASAAADGIRQLDLSLKNFLNN